MTQADKPVDIDAIEARANAATPGPWTQEAWLKVLRAMLEADAQEDIRVAAMLEEFPTARFKADANFIAHARTDIPDLIAAYRSQAAEIARLREQLAAARSVTDEKVQKARSAYNANFTAIIPDGDPAMRAALKAAMEKKV